MNLSRHILTVVSGLGLLSSGCVGADDSSDAEGIEAPSLETLEGPGGGTTNGLLAAGFQANKNNLRGAMVYGLFSQAPTINADIVTYTGLLSSEDGKDTFDYAVQCAAPTGTAVEHNGRTYAGNGLLSTTSGWTSDGLSDLAKKHLFGCVIAHLNAAGNEVPLYLTGDHVNPKNNQGDFTYPEAIWQANFDASGAVVFSAWPLTAVSRKCAQNTSKWMQYRICGSMDGGCGLTVHNNLSGCSKIDSNQNGVIDPDEEGKWSCNGGLAIQTWLEADGVSALYNGCEPAPQ